jgi:hypothetical protein
MGTSFIDVKNLRLGTNFSKQLRYEVQSCDAFIALIGPDWLDACDEHGNRRLDDPNDFVRIEVAAALKRDILVIPILLNGTKMPPADQLPPDLQELSFRQAFAVDNASFEADVERLTKELDKVVKRSDRPVFYDLPREFAEALAELYRPGNSFSDVFGILFGLYIRCAVPLFFILGLLLAMIWLVKR